MFRAEFLDFLSFCLTVATKLNDKGQQKIVQKLPTYSNIMAAEQRKLLGNYTNFTSTRSNRKTNPMCSTVRAAHGRYHTLSCLLRILR